MANDDEVMGFEITDRDLDEEFNFDLRRPRISKNRATYGIWAENSDEEDDPDARPSFGGGGGGRGPGRSRGGANYSAPVGFVSAGVQGAKRHEKKAEEEDPLEGPSGLRGGSSDEDELPRGGFGSGGRGGKKPKVQVEEGPIAGMRKAATRPNLSLGKGFGDWEKHTRGIGAKLLMQMGYEAGKGLGKELQGRSTIVEAHLRKGRGAIGAYGHEGGGPVAQKKKVDSDEEEEAQFKDKLHQWKRAGAGKKKVKYVYKTADQVLEEGKWRKVSKGDPTSAGAAAAAPTSKVKVIDMTGREERVLSGYHAIAAAKQRPDEDDVAADPVRRDRKQNFEIPELIHNINMLLDNCEEDLISADRRLKYHKNKVDVLKVEEEKLSKLVDKEKEEIDTIQGVLSLVEQLEERHESGQLDLASARDAFRQMEERYPSEYRAYELPHIAATVVAPLLKKELNTWAVLDAPFKYKAAFAEWKGILNITDDAPSSDESDPFYNLVWEAWMPSVRAAIVQWNTRNPDALIDFLKGWADLVPVKIMQNIRDLIVLPRLQAEVAQWDPMTDPVPIHSWLHPWLEVVGRQLDVVYPTIRQKLSAALSKWHPSDKSARLILLPWRDVFDRASLQAFLLKNIVPKLGETLATMEIDPSNQGMDAWRWFADWKDFLSAATLSALLEKHFFPRWLRVLASWLNHSPNYTEVTAWYQGWKREFASIPELLTHQQVQAHLGQALQMMNNAVSGGTPMSMQPGAFESMRYLASTEGPAFASASSGVPPPPPPPPLSQHPPLPMGGYAPVEQNIPQTFKDLLARKCAERGILFMPIPNRSYEGKQVYKCGNVMVYLDRTVIFVNRGGMWLHIDMDELLAKAL